jgi:methylenetetrahydrofolate reductase (NADPH)
MGRRALEQAERAGLARLLEQPKLEVLPLFSLDTELAAVGPGATLTVTSSPSKGIEASLAAVERLRAAGFEVVTHLAARMLRDRAHLREVLERLDAAGVDRAFVVGGDATRVGDYADGLALLRELAEIGHPFREIGVPGYPQGHPAVPEDRLRADLAAKATHAHYVTTQICFDADAIQRWIAACRADGLTLPVHLGIPGAVELARLLRVSARIGVTDAGRFVSRHAGLLRRFLRPRGYEPSALLEALAPTIADADAGVGGLHIYTFNQLARTERWRDAYLVRLRREGVDSNQR